MLNHARDANTVSGSTSEAEDEAGLRLALETGRFGYWRLNLVTQKAARTLLHDQMFGYDELLPEWTLNHFLAHVVEQERDRVGLEFSRAIERSEDWEFETRIVRADGAVRWIRAKGRHIRNSEGIATAMVGLVSDVTEQHERESALRASEARALRILQSIGDAVIVTDAAGVITKMNPVAEALTGWDEQSARGVLLSDVFRILNEDTRQFVENPVDKVRRLGMVVGLANHTVLIRKSGNEIHIDDSGAPIWEENGKLDGIVLVFRDVEERRALERQKEADFRELHSTHNKLQLAMEVARLGAFSYDGSTRLITVDSVNQKMFEMPDAVGPAEYWISKVHEDDQQRVGEAFAAASIGEKAYDIEYRVVRSDGVHWIQARAKLISKPGDPVVLTGITEDITLRKQQRDALRQTEKLAAVGRLAASIAHEINNPLESVTNLLYLARGTQEMLDVQKYLDTAERELRRVSVISNQTLRFYKQSTGPQNVMCNELFESVFSIYQGRLVNSGIQVEKRKRASRSILCFDGEIRQVLSNLVGNAIDAMSPDGGRLLVRSRDSRNWRTGEKGVALTVADTGSGMPTQVLRKVFEAFFTTKGIAGNGLGLWVSQEIVDRHRGTLLVRTSQKEAHSGTVFTLFLPFDAVNR